MCRYTENSSDIKRFSQVLKQLPFGGILRVKLVDGKVFEGVLLRDHSGNNGGVGGWNYYGEIELLSIDNKRYIIDYLDISLITDITLTHRVEYEERGLIQSSGD